MEERVGAANDTHKIGIRIMFKVHIDMPSATYRSRQKNIFLLSPKIFSKERKKIIKTNAIKRSSEFESIFTKKKFDKCQCMRN